MTLKCEICKKEISRRQLNYGDANPTKRRDGKIIARAFHHYCVEMQSEMTPEEEAEEINKRIGWAEKKANTIHRNNIEATHETHPHPAHE